MKTTVSQGIRPRKPSSAAQGIAWFGSSRYAARPGENTPEGEYLFLFRPRTLGKTEKEIKAMATLTYRHSPRWYRVALVSLGVALAVATALAVYFAVSRTTDVQPTVTRVTVTPVTPGPNCVRPLVAC